MPGPRAAGAPLDGALGAGRDFHRWNVRWNEFSTASARRRESPSLLPQAEAPKKNFVRGEWVVGRGLGLLRGPSSGWCVRCSPGRESLENGGPADSRRQWLGPLTTDGQPCGEHLTHQPLLGPLRRPKPRPTTHSHLTKQAAVARATAGKVLGIDGSVASRLHGPFKGSTTP